MMSNLLTSEKILRCLTSNILGRIIIKDAMPRYGIEINGYFNDRLRSKSDAKINDETKFRLLTIYRKELNLENADNIDSNTFANKMIDELTALGIAETVLNKYRCYNPEEPNIYNKTILYEILQVILSHFVDSDATDISTLNNDINTSHLEIIHNAKFTTLSTDNKESKIEFYRNLDAAGELQFISNASRSMFMNKVTSPSSKFIGRESLLNDIESKISEHGYSIIKGIGGIGKTDIAKKYAALHKKDYDEIIFIPFNNDLKHTVLTINCTEDPLFSNESQEQRFQRIINKLASVGKRLLLIIDNMETLSYNEPFFQELVAYDFDVIITTRTSWEDALEIPSLSISEVRELFNSHAPKYRNLSSENQLSLNELFEFVEYHTLTIELIAKLLQHSTLSPKDLLLKTKQELNKSDSTLLQINKDGITTQNTMYNHLASLYELNFSEQLISDGAEEILVNLALIPEIGFPVKEALKLFDLANTNMLNNLADLGWIKIDDLQIIHIHPLIKELLLAKYSQQPEIFNLVLNNLKKVATSRDSERNYEIDTYICELIFSIASRISRNDIDWCVNLTAFIVYLNEFDHIEKALTIFSKVETIIAGNPNQFDPIKLFTCYLYGSRLYINASIFDLADEYYKRCYALAETLSAHEKYEYIEQELSILYADLQRAEGNTYRALQAYNSILHLGEKNLEVNINNIDAYRSYIELLQIDSQNYPLCNDVYLDVISYTESVYGNNSIYVAQVYAAYAFFRCKYKPDEVEINTRHAQKALNIFKDKNFENSTEQAFAYIAYAKCCRCGNDLDNAVQYLLAAKQIYLQHPECDLIDTCISELAEIYADMNDYDSAITEFTILINHIIHNMNSNYQIFTQQLCISYFQRGICYLHKGQFNKAINDFLSCLYKWEDTGDQTSIFFTADTLLGQLYYSTCVYLNEEFPEEILPENIVSLCKSVIETVARLSYVYSYEHPGFLHYIAERIIGSYVTLEHWSEGLIVCNDILSYFEDYVDEEAQYFDLLLYKAVLSLYSTQSLDTFPPELLEHEDELDFILGENKNMQAMAYFLLHRYYASSDPNKSKAYFEKGKSIYP